MHLPKWGIILILVVVLLVLILAILFSSRLSSQRAGCDSKSVVVGDAQYCLNIQTKHIHVFQGEGSASISIVGAITGSRSLGESVFIALGFPGCKTVWIRGGKLVAEIDVASVDHVWKVQGAFVHLGGLNKSGQLASMWFDSRTGYSAITGFVGHTMLSPVKDKQQCA